MSAASLKGELEMIDRSTGSETPNHVSAKPAPAKQEITQQASAHPGIQIMAVPGFPIIEEPCDIASVIGDSLEGANLLPLEGDVVCVAQKVVSKAEGRLVDLREVKVSQKASELAEKVGKSSELVQVILDESNRVEIDQAPHLITEHRLGFVCANAGVDRSNVDGGDHMVCLLPENPDRSAEQIRVHLKGRFGVDVAVLVTDTHGRPFRKGAVGVCIGVAGLEPLRTYVATEDLFGRKMLSTGQGVGDELAAAASLMMGQGNEGTPLVIIRGYAYGKGNRGVGALLRPLEQDLFRRHAGGYPV